MKFRRLGFFAAVLAAFTAGSRVGVKYAKDHYVSKDRKFIEAEPVKKTQRDGNG